MGLQVYVLLNEASCLSHLNPGLKADLTIKSIIALDEPGLESSSTSDVLPFINKKAHWPNNIIAIDQSISRESFPQEGAITAPKSGTNDWEPQSKNRIVNDTLQRDGEQILCFTVTPMIMLVAFPPVLFWIVSSGTPEILGALAILYLESLSYRLSINFPGPASVESDLHPPLSSKQDIAAVESASNLVTTALVYATRLAGEGYVDAANTIIEALCTHYPNDLPKQRTPPVCPLEFLWHTCGVRPACVELFWGASPDEANLREVYSDIQLPHPETNEEKARALVVADDKILDNFRFEPEKKFISRKTLLFRSFKFSSSVFRWSIFIGIRTHEPTCDHFRFCTCFIACPLPCFGVVSQRQSLHILLSVNMDVQRELQSDVSRWNHAQTNTRQKGARGLANGSEWLPYRRRVFFRMVVTAGHDCTFTNSGYSLFSHNLVEPLSTFVKDLASVTSVKSSPTLWQFKPINILQNLLMIPNSFRADLRSITFVNEETDFFSRCREPRSTLNPLSTLCA
ncbi:hypothetical protein J3R30DRAFT_2895553 [Lentinula aciculospora]|uniref:Uncharacterized protein n=1 Tax=Lentinula aciculospora TaxID=153920 RepID=A0A9W9AAR9_9AGAR|nr:hypothetical protein J3R30DRAFT_2895553 [Lentinula aciculospora]